MFHVATLMPTRASDTQCSGKKKHIGNDFVVIVYNNSGHEYTPPKVSGKWNLFQSQELFILSFSVIIDDRAPDPLLTLLTFSVKFPARLYYCHASSGKYIYGASVAQKGTFTGGEILSLGIRLIRILI